ncbi:LysR family transcriptional regulator [Paraburkholderia sp. NPDC080076]|uniref:LysR family transcriptional regulator n=1 Tax=Paraburkholderia sp. NPDC080076 TaxID=3390605 RepID=UPI003D0802F5
MRRGARGGAGCNSRRCRDADATGHQGLPGCGGFTAAGEALRRPKSTLSHRVKELEASLRVRLISRPSRQFAMTEVGQELYQ